MRALLFDLDNTVIGLGRSTHEVLDETFAQLGVEPLFSAEAYGNVRKRYEDHTLSKRELRERCFVELVKEQGLEAEVGRNAAATYSELRETRGTSWQPGARRAFQQLADDYALGVVTNGIQKEQQAKIEAIGLEEYLETVVFAGDSIPAKPDPQPFLEALSELDVLPEEAAFIGDSLSEDIRGAHAVGMRTVWIQTDEPLVDRTQPDFVISSMDELVPLPWNTE